MNNLDWASIEHFETKKTLSKKDLFQVLKHMKEDLLLVIDTEYGLTPGLEFLELSSELKFYFGEKLSARPLSEHIRPRAFSDIKLRFQSNIVDDENKSLENQFKKIEKEYQLKLAESKKYEDKIKAKIWHKKQITEAKFNYKKSVHKKINEKKETLLKREFSAIDNKHKIKLKNALDQKERKLLRIERDEEKRKTREKIEYFTLDHNRKQLWLQNNGRKLKEQINVGIKEIGILFNGVINNAFYNIAKNQKNIKIQIQNLNGTSDKIGSTKGHRIGSDVLSKQKHFCIKRKPGNDIYANYYSVPNDKLIYAKKFRH